MARNKSTRPGLVVLTLILLVTGGWLALGEQAMADRDSNRKASIRAYAKRLADAKLTLGQAVAKAEELTGGKAIQAQCEPEGEGLEISVLVLVGEQFKEIEFDAMTGKQEIDDDDEHGDDDDDNDDDNDDDDDDDDDEHGDND